MAASDGRVAGRMKKPHVRTPDLKRAAPLDDLGIMRRSVTIWFLAAIPILAGGLAAQTSPIGPGTVPPSSYQNGLITTPSPIDPSNNLVITGNVRGAKHFRGPLPYESTTDFGARLGSASLDSFLRYSAPPNELRGRTRDYGTFHSPTGTVSTMQPGRNSVFAPVSPRVAGSIRSYHRDQPTDTLSPADLPPPHASAGRADSAVDSTLGRWSGLALRPRSRTSDQMQDPIAGELGDRLPDRRMTQPGNEDMTPEQYRQRLERLQRELDRIENETGRLEQQPGDTSRAGELFAEDRTEGGTDRREPEGRVQSQRLQPLSPARPPLPGDAQPPNAAERSNPARGLETPSPADPLSSRSTDTASTRFGQPSDADRYRGATAAQRDRIDAIFAPHTRRGSTETDADGVSELPAVQRIRETQKRLDVASRYLENPVRESAIDERTGEGRVSATMDRLRTAAGSQNAAADIPEQMRTESEPQEGSQLIGDRVREKYEGHGTVAQERYDRYMKAAELYMQEGRYDRAADSFTLASMYKPEEARPYLRKAHALLAAGEYVSSALILGKALEFDPRESLGQVDLIEALGGPDPFVERIGDLEQRAEQNDAPQLQFLLAYIYYQMDRPPQAKAAIETAARQLPSSPAIDILRSAIGG